MEFEHIMEDIARGFEVVGVAIILIGGLMALVSGARTARTANRFFDDVRSGFGRPLLLGLEVLVAADIIQTITVGPTLSNAAALGIVVLVRVVLSFSLDVEMDGMAPWRRREMAAVNSDPNASGEL